MNEWRMLSINEWTDELTKERMKEETKEKRKEGRNEWLVHFMFYVYALVVIIKLEYFNFGLTTLLWKLLYLVLTCTYL